MNEGLPTHLDLFSGVGGFSLAFEAEGFRTIGFSEIDPYACAVLKKHWPNVPNFGDIKNVTAEAVANAAGKCKRKAADETNTKPARRKARNEPCNCGECDGPRNLVTVLTGGFPCQPFSVAGKRRGAGDDRALWPEMLSVIEQVRPAFVLGENVPGIINMELDRVLSDLEAIGYAARTFVIPACAVDARHRRDRVWIVANTNSGQCLESIGGISTGRHAINGSGEVLADATGERSGETGRLRRNEQAQRPAGSGETLEHSESGRRERQSGETSWERQTKNGFSQPGQDVADTDERGLRRRTASGSERYVIQPSRWPVEPSVGRVADGVPNRSHCLKCLGNSIVPEIAQVFDRAIYREITD